MRKYTLVLSMLLVVAMITSSLAMASSETGTGQDRTVSFSDPYQFTNATVIVPAVLNNESANSFEFTVLDESGSASDFGFYILVNGTIYDDVNITSVDDGNATGWVNFTADAFELGDDVDINVTMYFTSNYTAVDWWNGTVDIVDANTFSIRITTVELVMSMMGIVIVILLISKVLGSIKDVEGKKKK